MVIFKKQKQDRLKEKKRVVGIYLPTSLTEYLSLYALVQGISVASIVQELVIKWKEEQITSGYFDELLTESLKEKTKTCFSKSKLKPNDFSKLLEKELSTKGISKSVINRIKLVLKWKER